MLFKDEATDIIDWLTSAQSQIVDLAQRLPQSRREAMEKLTEIPSLLGKSSLN